MNQFVFVHAFHHLDLQLHHLSLPLSLSTFYQQSTCNTIMLVTMYLHMFWSRGVCGWFLCEYVCNKLLWYWCKLEQSPISALCTLLTSNNVQLKLEWLSQLQLPRAWWPRCHRGLSNLDNIQVDRETWWNNLCGRNNKVQNECHSHVNSADLFLSLKFDPLC